jgi:hypothetical protein
MKVKFVVKIMNGAMIKGENKEVKPMIKIMDKLYKLKMLMMDPFNVNLKHHTQEYIKWFNGIIPSTTFLEVSKEG